MIKLWYQDGYLVGYPMLFLWCLLLAALFYFRPSWADRLYRGFGFAITPRRGRVLSGLFIAGALYEAVAWVAYLVIPN